MGYPFSEPQRLWLQYALPLTLALLALATPRLARSGSRRARLLHTTVLAATVLLGFGVYSNNNWEKGRYFNPYEFFHYYVGAKYAPEIGYTRQYDAAVLVDRETGHVHGTTTIANLAAHAGGGEYKRLGEVYRDEAAIRAPFSPERWAEFRADVVYFRDQLDPAIWERLLLDKGYNATPFWTLLGGSLANAVPTSSRAGMQALAGLDILLLLLGLGCAGWAFGARAMLLAAALYLTHYCTGHAHFRAAFLRTDWIVALLASLSLAKKGHAGAAGACAAVAALGRVFPALFVFGVVAQAAWALLRWRRPEPAVVRFLAGFALAFVVLFGTSLAHGGGFGPWREFAAKIAEHDARPAADTVGFRTLFLGTASYDESQGRDLRRRFEELALLWWSLQALFALALAWVLRAKPLHEAIALGFVLIWCLTAPAYYYYALLLAPLLYLADELERPGRALGLALLFLTSVAARWLHPGREMTLEFSFRLSLVLGALALALFLLAWLEERSAPTPTRSSRAASS